MTNAAPRPVRSPAAETARAALALSLSVVASAVLGGAGVIVGLRMALHVRVVACPDGTEFPQGDTDMRCFSHPHAGAGVGLAIVAALLTLLVVLVTWQLRIAVGLPVVPPPEPAAADTSADAADVVQPAVSDGR